MFVIPMAGMSSRFSRAGYDKPKYMLPLFGGTVFSWSLGSFTSYFSTDKFIFVYRDICETEAFLRKEITRLGIQNYKLVKLENPTQGQAETVYRGVEQESISEEIYIFNIDSRIDDFIKPSWVERCDGYLEVFKGDGDHWSFAESSDGLNVLRTAEKERISDYCSDGLYYFRSKGLFDNTFNLMKEISYVSKSEFYIAPMYNLIIERGGAVYLDLINEERIHFCGTPDEYLQQLGMH